MRRVTGIGGIFFKSADPQQLKTWYQQHLGITPDQDGYISFEWREKDDPSTVGHTVWGPFKDDTKHFQPSTKPYMFNFRVDDLDALLAQLRAEGVEVDDKVEEYEYGRFGWIMDPEGRRIELWEPPREGETD
jgi:predicted enzyme related to lactoylglutathione lyase